MPRPLDTQSTATEPSASTDSTGGGGLLLVAGEGLLTTFPLLGDEVVIGRAPECDVVIAHATLSRRHAVLRLGPPLSIQDLGSKNGLRVARQRVHGGDPITLAVGESFHIGRFSFAVVRPPRSASLSTKTGGVDALRVIDPTVEKATSLVRDIAKSGLNALVLGETGVGKEVLAATLHELSGRKGAFVCVNCAALTANLFESELFGHEKGAFTGAVQSRAGLLEAAQGGTVFLDEVGELPSEAQAKLLRAIENKKITRVGAVKPIALEIRFVAATNRDLAGDVARGSFRSDLYFRLDGVTLVIPPLRDRREQIGPLALSFLKEAQAKRDKRAPLQVAADLLPRLEAYDWPGNVRELKAVLERALLLARGEIQARHLALAPLPRSRPDSATDLSDRDNAQRQRIVDALAECNGNQTRAAKKLGMSRSTLVTKLALYKIPRPRV